jgi:hypothetical protein
MGMTWGGVKITSEGAEMISVKKDYAYISFPLGSGIFLPNSFAVSIHSEIIICIFFK